MERGDALVRELEQEASATAQRIMRTWLPMMFGADELQELCAAYGVAPAAAGEEYEALFERLTDPFTAAHLTQLHRPPGNLVPLLLESEAHGKDARQGWGSKLDMYWRGALSLHKMQVPMLQSMLQKRPYLHEYLAEAVESEGDGTSNTSDSEQMAAPGGGGLQPPTEEEMGAIADPHRQSCSQPPCLSLPSALPVHLQPPHGPRRVSFTCVRTAVSTVDYRRLR